MTLYEGFDISMTNTEAYNTGCWVLVFVWNTSNQPEHFVAVVYTAC